MRIRKQDACSDFREVKWSQWWRLRYGARRHCWGPSPQDNRDIWCARRRCVYSYTRETRLVDCVYVLIWFHEFGTLGALPSRMNRQPGIRRYTSRGTRAQHSECARARRARLRGRRGGALSGSAQYTDAAGSDTPRRCATGAPAARAAPSAFVEQ